MKRKILVCMVLAVLLSMVVGCRQLSLANTNEENEPGVVQYEPVESFSSNETVIPAASETSREEKMEEVFGKNIKDTASSEKKAEKTSEKASDVEKVDTKIVLKSTDSPKDIATGEITTQNNIEQVIQKSNKQDAKEESVQQMNQDSVTNTMQNEQIVPNTTGKTVTENKVQPGTNNTVAQTTKQQQTTQNTTQTQPQNNNVQTTTSTDNGGTTPAPGTPEFDAMTKAWEEQIAAENNQPQNISSSDNQKLLDDINAYRAENGLNPLTWSDELGEQANKRATEQTDNIVNNGGNLDHNYGNANGMEENLSGRQGDDVLEGWKNSPGHNNVLLDPNATSAGVATGNVGDGEGNGITVLVVE